MNFIPDKWLDPVQALSRFDDQDISIFRHQQSEDSVVRNRFGYMLGNIGILVPEHALCEVVRSFKVFPVPNIQAWMQGLVNLRGNLVPVYDLALLLGLSEVPMEHKNLLVLEKAPDSIGILVDNLPKSRDISRWHALTHSPKLPGGLTEFIDEVYAVNENIWICFDHVLFFESIREKIAG